MHANFRANIQRALNTKPYSIIMIYEYLSDLSLACTDWIPFCYTTSKFTFGLSVLFVDVFSVAIQFWEGTRHVIIIQCSMFYTAHFIEKRNVYLSSHTGTIYPSYPSKPKLWPYMQFSTMLLHIFVMQAITLQQRISLLPVNCSAAKKYLGSCLNYLMVLLFAVTSFTHNICRQRRNKR